MHKKILLAQKEYKPKGKPLSTYVDDDLRARVEKIAEDSGVSISHAVRLLIVAGLDYHEQYSEG